MSTALNSHITTVVRNIVEETPRVMRFELTCPDFWELPAFTAGAHVDVVLPGGDIRQYSLCGDPSDRYRYQIAVQRDDLGRGGSLAMHRLVKEGMIMPISMPKNLFGLSAVAQRHTFIAGGIGITPFISMIIELERRGGLYELHYCAKNLQETAFLKVLEHRIAKGSVHIYHSGKERLDLTKLLQAQRPGEHVYCCGPSKLLDAFLEATQHWVAETVHYERFGKQPNTIETPPYEVRLAKSERMVQVGANQTLAAALMAAGAPIKVACEAGVCGTCKVRYLSGTPVHGDLILSAEDRAEIMTPCVSHGLGTCLELDL